MAVIDQPVLNNIEIVRNFLRLIEKYWKSIQNCKDIDQSISNLGKLEPLE